MEHVNQQETSNTKNHGASLRQSGEHTEQDGMVQLLFFSLLLSPT